MKVSHLTEAPVGTRKTWLPKLSPRAMAILRAAGTGLAWALLAFSVFTLGMALGWLLLAWVRLGIAPKSESIPPALIVIALTAGFAWLAGKSIGSIRKAGLFVGGGLALILLTFVVWSFAFPLRALFLARTIGWGPSDVSDYQKFPARPIANAEPNFYFQQAPNPALFQTVEYVSDGVPLQKDMQDFMESTNTTSFLVIKDDVILYEGYFNGYARDSIVTSFSMAKSVTSALVGIAIQEGYIGSVNDPVIQYLPEMKGRGLDDLTIRHLLTMSSGIRYVADNEVPILKNIFQFTDDGLSYSYPDLRSQALSIPAGNVPVGAEFNYNNYHPQLLGMILERTTGMHPATYLQEKIWKPLGMEYPASWSLDSEETGFELMTAGINARAFDFARFGRLFLEKGNWQGQQVIPAAWVEESTAPDPSDQRVFHSDPDWKAAGGYYKYLWWGYNRPDGGYDYVARGHNGQFIYVAPKEHMIVLRFGIDLGGVDSWERVMQGMVEKATGTKTLP